MDNFDWNILIAPIFALIGAWIGASSTIMSIKKQVKYDMLTKKQEKLALLSSFVWQFQKMIVDNYIRKNIQQLSPKEKTEAKIHLDRMQNMTEQIIRAYFPKVCDDFIKIYENIYNILSEFEKANTTKKNNRQELLKDIATRLDKQVDILDKKVNNIIQDEIEKELWLQESSYDNMKWIVFKKIKSWLKK